jgi:hypothetical protein
MNPFVGASLLCSVELFDAFSVIVGSFEDLKKPVKLPLARPRELTQSSFKAFFGGGVFMIASGAAEDVVWLTALLLAKIAG